MTELELYKFIKYNNIEWHRRENEGVQDIVIMPFIFNLEEFCKLIKGYNVDGGGLLANLLDGYVAIWMSDLCEYFGIDINNVFIGEEY